MSETLTQNPEAAMAEASEHPKAARRSLRERLAAATVDNPVLVKEFRTRMRGTRAYWILLGYTLLIAAILGFIYYLFEQSVATSDGFTAASRSAQTLGRVMYHVVFISQAVMVALITPAITAGAITIEREQRSYDLLVTTPLRPADLIRGKLAAAVSFVVLLLTASLPLVSLTFLVGGVSPAEIFFSYVLIALGAYVCGATGIFWSATLRSTAVATVATYMTVLALFMVSVVPGIAAVESGRTGTGAAPEIPFQSLNPIMGNFRAVQPEYFFAWELPSWVSASVLMLLFGSLMALQGMARLEHFEKPRPFWPRLLATGLWTAVCAFLLGPLLGGMLHGTTMGGIYVDETLQLVMVLTCAVVPIWNTGDLVVPRGHGALGSYLRGFLPWRAFRDDLPNGLPLTLLWVAIVAALFPLGALTAGKVTLVFQSGALVPGLLLLGSVVFGFAGLGHLLSVTLPSRWAACLVTYAVMVGCVLLPYFVVAPWAQSVQPRFSPIWSLLYLVPFEGLAELGAPSGFWSFRTPMPVRPVWLASSVLYLGLGLAGFIAAAARVRRVDTRKAAPPAA